MIKPTVLLVWPKHCDFPICRYNLTRFKNYFQDVYIAFSEHHREEDLSNFVRSQLPFAHFVDVERSEEDWRSDAVNQLLNAIPPTKHVLFLEQDFLIRDATFFDRVFSLDIPFAYYLELDRIHPAFAVVERSLVDKTSRDFAPHAPGDHFFKFFSEIGIGTRLEALGVIPKVDYYHMAGLTQNYTCFKYGDPLYRPNNFLYYNFKSIELPVENHPSFYQMEIAIDREFGHPRHHQFLKPFFA